MRFIIGAASLLVLVHAGCTEPDLKSCAPWETMCGEECQDGPCSMSDMDGGLLDMEGGLQDAAFDAAADGSKEPPAEASVEEPLDDGGETLRCPVTLHVNGSAMQEGDGKSWQTALRTLEGAIERAGIAIERCGTATIWLAQGRYTRTAGRGPVPFDLPPGLELYGGFAGTELALSERKLEPSATILDGEGEGTIMRVVGTAGDHPSTVIDGVTFTRGESQWWASSDRWGAGVHVKDAHVAMRNLMFVSNKTEEEGGTLTCEGASTLEITNSTFTDNGYGRGGAIASSGCTVQIDRTRIVGNSEWSEIYLGGGVLTITNSVLAGSGGATSNFDDARVQLVHSILVAHPDGTLPINVYLTDLRLRASIVWGVSPPAAPWPRVEAACVQGLAATASTLDCTSAPFRSFGAPASSWTSFEYDADHLQTLLRDSEASFQPGALVGHFIDFFEGPEGSPAKSLRWGIIAANDAKSLRVWGDFRWFLGQGVRYAIYDLTPHELAPTVDRAPPGAPDRDIDGRTRIDMPNTGKDPSIADVGPYEQTRATLEQCLSGCPAP